MKKKIPAYAILRFDDMNADGASIYECVSVTSVLPTHEDAELEVKRLNELNGEKGARYLWVKTRYYPAGSRSKN